MNNELSKNAENQAFRILQIGFFIIPLLAGIDKFVHFLGEWHIYLSEPFNILGNAYSTMMLVGIIEIIAAFGILFKPKIFAYIISLWLLVIIINLIFLGKYYDVALRDFGLMLSSLALARLSK